MRARFIYFTLLGWMLHGIPTFGQSNISLDFSNDVWDKTDRYYTQGLKLAYFNPALAKPVNYLFPQLVSHASTTITSVELFQDIYTPTTYNTNVYNPNDRPYSAVLAANYIYRQQFKNSFSTIQLNGMLGIIGKAALGEEVQNKVHDIIDNLDALGWGYQLRTGLLLNAGSEFELNLLNLQPFRLSSMGGAQLGTYKTNAQLGLTIYLEKETTSYMMPLQPKAGSTFHQQLILQGAAIAVGYDATLEGALFQNYTYGLPSDKINRLTMLSKAEYRLMLGSFQFGVTQYIQSPQFEDALWHKWVTIHLGFWF